MVPHQSLGLGQLVILGSADRNSYATRPLKKLTTSMIFLLLLLFIDSIGFNHQPRIQIDIHIYIYMYVCIINISMDLKTIENFVSFFGKLHSITMPNRDNRDLFLGFAYTGNGAPKVAMLLREN